MKMKLKDKKRILAFLAGLTLTAGAKASAINFDNSKVPEDIHALNNYVIFNNMEAFDNIINGVTYEYDFNEVIINDPKVELYGYSNSNHQTVKVDKNYLKPFYVPGQTWLYKTKYLGESAFYLLDPNVNGHVYMIQGGPEASFVITADKKHVGYVKTSDLMPVVQSPSAMENDSDYYKAVKNEGHYRISTDASGKIIYPGKHFLNKYKVTLGTELYNDKNLTDVCESVKQGQRVFIIDEFDDVAFVEYNFGRSKGYIKTNLLKSDEEYNARCNKTMFLDFSGNEIVPDTEELVKGKLLTDTRLYATIDLEKENPYQHSSHSYDVYANQTLYVIKDMGNCYFCIDERGHNSGYIDKNLIVVNDITQTNTNSNIYSSQVTSDYSTNSTSTYVETSSSYSSDSTSTSYNNTNNYNSNNGDVALENKGVTVSIQNALNNPYFDNENAFESNQDLASYINTSGFVPLPYVSIPDGDCEEERNFNRCLLEYQTGRNGEKIDAINNWRSFIKEPGIKYHVCGGETKDYGNPYYVLDECKLYTDARLAFEKENYITAAPYTLCKLLAVFEDIACITYDGYNACYVPYRYLYPAMYCNENTDPGFVADDYYDIPDGNMAGRVVSNTVATYLYSDPECTHPTYFIPPESVLTIHALQNGTSYVCYNYPNVNGFVRTSFLDTSRDLAGQYYNNYEFTDYSTLVPGDHVSVESGITLYCDSNMTIPFNTFDYQTVFDVVDVLGDRVCVTTNDNSFTAYVYTKDVQEISTHTLLRELGFMGYLPW